MTPTATYIAEENCLQELPQIEEPDFRKYGEMYGVAHEWDLEKYNAHLATLRKIPCDPSCKGLWQDQQKLVEGKDYEVRSNDYLPPSAIEEMLTALPLVPVKSEDELWNELVKEGFIRETAIEGLKNKYIITKR